MNRINRRGRAGSQSAGRTSQDGKSQGAVVTALARGLAVLQAVGQGKASSNSDIAGATGLPKATVARLVNTLLELDYVVEGKGRRGYQIGSGAMSLGYSYLAMHDICELVRPMLRHLADHFPCACSLVIREELQLVYLAQARSRSARLMINVSVGSRLSLADHAGGLALLAGSYPDESTVVSGALRDEHPGSWPRKRSRIQTAQKELETRGFCSALDFNNSGIHAVSVPLRSRDQLYAITCAAPTAIVTKEFMLVEVGPELGRLCQDLQKRLPR